MSQTPWTKADCANQIEHYRIRLVQRGKFFTIAVVLPTNLWHSVWLKGKIPTSLCHSQSFETTEPALKALRLILFRAITLWKIQAKTLKPSHPLRFPPGPHIGLWQRNHKLTAQNPSVCLSNKLLLRGRFIDLVHKALARGHHGTIKTGKSML